MILTRAAGEGDREAVEGATSHRVPASAPSTTTLSRRGPPPPFAPLRGRIAR
jgi:crossover junction endodeoxyribonuclease RuvC